MRHRFTRGRRSRNAGESKAQPIDAVRWLERIAAAGVVEVANLVPRSEPDVPASFAALGAGENEAGGRVLVGFAPEHGGDAALAVLSLAQKLRAEGETLAEAVAVAPQWSVPARTRLTLFGELPFAFRALAVSALDEEGGLVVPGASELPLRVPAAWLAETLPQESERDVFRRALVALEGLAAKHGGSVRASAGGVELVLMARRVAVLSASSGGVTLETLLPDRASAALDADGLSAAMDRLEGQLRRRLNDRHVRDGEEGVRARALAGVSRMLGLDLSLPWPLPGSDPEVLDLAGVDAEGRAVVAAVRSRVGLPVLGEILDAAERVRRTLPVLFAGARALRPGPIRLALVAEQVDAAAQRVLALLELDHAVYDLQPQRAGSPELVLRGEGAAAPPRESEERGGRGRRRRGRRSRNGDGRDRDADSARDEGERGRAREERDERVREGRGERGERMRDERGERMRDERGERMRDERGERMRDERGERMRDERGERMREERDEGMRDEREGRDERDEGEREERPAARSREAREEEGGEAGGVEDLSLFDLDDDARGSDQGRRESGRPRRRRRGRRRGRRGGGEEAPAAEPAEGPGRGGPDEDDVDALLDVDTELDHAATLAPLAEEAVGGDEGETAVPYEEEEEEAGEEDWAQEREARRRARLAKITPEPEREEAPRRPRRRSAFVVHADRDSLAAGILLARDIRLVEGFWVYPQAELMTFFRSVATDLRPDTPIYLVGFTARPARDVLQAASLYAGRLSWFDHHEWPPEDLEALRRTLGEDNVDVAPWGGSSLPAVLAERVRRSRFSDKLVELVTGRFTPHDYERWGRVWWHRLGEIAERPGERRHAIDPLLSGRPSDLTREAARAEPPPPPAELAFVAERDFRLVHFGGYTLVVVPVPEGLDLHLSARVARERFGAQLSVALREGGELVVLGGDEGRGRRGLDLGAMVAYLASKHEWIEALRDEDHLPRLRVRGLATRPERLDEVISELAMGRSILEG